MTSIYTRAGDAGETSLADGERILKSSARVEAYGAVDEANAHVGLARTLVLVHEDAAELEQILRFVQQRLYNCAASLAMPSEHAGDQTPHVSDDDVVALERAIDSLIARAGEIDHFVIPGGTELACRLQIARTVARRAERRVVALAQHEAVDELALRFLNRSSDLLFAAARFANVALGVREESWDPRATAPES